MKLLVVSTASQCCFISYVCDDFRQTITFSSYQKTSECLLPQIDKLLKKNKIKLDGLDAICVCVGPGSFTGIRVGIATVKAFCLAKNLPVITFSVFDCFSKTGTLLTKANSGGAYCKKGESISFLSREQLAKLNDKNLYIFKQEKEYFENEFAGKEDIIDGTINCCIKKFNEKKYSLYSEIQPIYVLNSQAENELDSNIKNAKILPLKLENAKEIFELEQECFEDFYSLKTIENLFMQDNKKVFGLTIKNKLVGYASFSTVLDEAELERVCIIKKYRNLNLASLLLEECFRLIKAKKVLLEVNKKNEIAIKLYVKLGFIKNGERKNYYGKDADAVLMQKVF